MSYECVKLMRTKYYLLSYYETGFVFRHYVMHIDSHQNNETDYACKKG